MFLNKIGWTVAVILIAEMVSSAQVNRYMVFFKDKSGTPFTTSNPLVYLSQKAIDRRTKQSVSITQLDFPVNADYVQNVRNTGATTFFKTRWMNGVLVQCNASLVPSIQALGCVAFVELVAPNTKLLGGRLGSVSNSKQVNIANNATTSQLQMLGIDKMHSDNFHGEGITIALLDAGFPGVNTSDPFQLLRDDNRINLTASYDFVYNTIDVFRYDSHGTEVLSTIAALQEPLFTGGAYKANFQLYVTEDVTSEYRIEEYNWLFAAERADSAGVDIISTSLGYNEFNDANMNYSKADLNGRTAVITQAAQFAADRGILVICSAGNEGGTPWQTITAPADANDVLAVANVTALGKHNITSSTGPTADNRIKPDLAALGTSVIVITPDGSLGNVSGTSLSAPLITSLAAGVWQKYPDHTNKAIMEAMKQSASLAGNPDNFLGYGIPNYTAISNYFSFVPQAKTFELFPNPFFDTINISPKSPGEVSACRFQVVTIQGQILVDHTVEFNWLNPIYTADLTSVTSGIYFARIWFSNKVFVFKIGKR